MPSHLDRLDIDIPIYYINLARKPLRKVQFLNNFAGSQIKPIRINAFNGKSSDLLSNIHGPLPEFSYELPRYVRINLDMDHFRSQIGCTFSHLKAIETWLNQSRSPFVLICEDDLSFDLLKYWNFSLSEFIKALPSDWDCVQLCSINPGHAREAIRAQYPAIPRKFRLKKWSEPFWGTGGYLIKREYGHQLFNRCKTNNRYNLGWLNHKQFVADQLIYSFGNVYSIDLLRIMDLGSDIRALKDQGIAINAETANEWWSRIGCKLPLSILTRIG